MSQLFFTLLYQPIFNALVLLYNVVPGNDLGVAIVLLTVALKLVLQPLTVKSLRSQRELQRIQPQVAALQKQYKGKQAELSAALMTLYKSEKVNPMSSCLPLLLQLPILIAIYQVFAAGLSKPIADGVLYPLVHNPGTLNHFTLGSFDLLVASPFLAVLAGLAQFWQTKMMVTKRPPVAVPGSKDEDMAAVMNKQMVYVMPAMTVVIGLSLPSGLSLYWLVTTLLTVLQQRLFFRKHDASQPLSPPVVPPAPPTTLVTP